MASHGSSAPGAPTADGEILETMDSGQYTYVRVKTASGEIWAATSPIKVKVGDKITVPLDSPMQNFHSPTLNRDFPLIYFAAFIGRAGEPLPTTAAPPDLTQITEPIAPAPGGTSIAKLWTDRKALSGKSVTLRGKVVKYNGNILGFDWTHIQDGSGDAKAGTNDITITTAPGAPGKIGDIVTVTGTVVLDKDFGAGYAYTVMIQNATITVK
jgi:hypothetical protein